VSHVNAVPSSTALGVPCTRHCRRVRLGTPQLWQHNCSYIINKLPTRENRASRCFRARCLRAITLGPRHCANRSGGLPSVCLLVQVRCLLRCTLCSAMALDIFFEGLAHNPGHAAVEITSNAFGAVPKLVFHSQSANRCIHAAILSNTMWLRNGKQCSHTIFL
jgi:hypothetical protein